MKAAAIIIDLKDSRKLEAEKRLEAQEKFAEAVDYFLNPVFKKELAARLRFSAGDSVQGVCKNPGDAINCYLMARALLYPLEIRCGVGAGEVIGLELFQDTNRLDGQAYHNAAKALELCREEDLGILFVSGNNNDPLINQYFSNARHIEAMQSSKRKVLTNTIFLLDPIAQPAQYLQYKESAFKAFLGLLRYYGQVEEAEGGKLLKQAFFKSYNLYTNGPVLSKRVVDSFLQVLLAKLLGVTAENMRQMIIKSGINEIKRNYICASMLADKTVWGY